MTEQRAQPHTAQADACHCCDPVTDATPELTHLRASAFRYLLEAGDAIDVEHLAQQHGVAGSKESLLKDLRGYGGLDVDGNGRILGICGLTLSETPHRLEIGRETRYTWCAMDALGILAAAGRGGRVTSTSPATAAPIQVAFEGSVPQTSDVALLLVGEEVSENRITITCADVNFFEDVNTAQNWNESRGLGGKVMTVAEATQLGEPSWKSLLDAAELVRKSTRRRTGRERSDAAGPERGFPNHRHSATRLGSADTGVGDWAEIDRRWRVLYPRLGLGDLLEGDRSVSFSQRPAGEHRRPPH